MVAGECMDNMVKYFTECRMSLMRVKFSVVRG